MKGIVELETKLYDLDPGVRAEGLAELAALIRVGGIEPDPECRVVNMHCHTFFSFNAYGHSPTSLAWLGKQRGFKLMGIVDFDVLDGVDEFLDACQVLGMRGTAGIETRVFVPEKADLEINSAGEPGVCYHMGIGFVTGRVPDAVAPILADLGSRADQRNRDILARINDHLDPVTINYERDVLPLTPAGHPTERHMVLAYVQTAARTVSQPVAFWADRLGLAPDEMATIMADSARFQNIIRARLMRRGGIGCIQAKSGMFPLLQDFHELVVGCGALPCAAWLDGTLEAEQDPEAWLAFMVGKGVVALNIIPDRNWNIAHPTVKRLKLKNLYRIVDLAREMDLPLNVGTEMNSFGQKLLDSFDAPELAPVRQAFVDGAHLIFGHTVMQRVLELGFQSAWAQSHLPTRRQRNEFYMQIGYQVPPGPTGIRLLQQLGRNPLPDEVLRWTGATPVSAAQCRIGLG
jgi:hypothetical protein